MHWETEKPVFLSFARSNLLDGHRRETGCKNKGLVLEHYIETRCCFLWCGNKHRRGCWENVWWHCSHTRCPGGEGIMLLWQLDPARWRTTLSFIHLVCVIMEMSAWFLQVGKFLQLMSLFIGGFVVAFIKGWLLTLVLLSSIPFLVIAGAVMSLIIANTASQGQNAYAKAATVVEQTIGSIRTVGLVARNIFSIVVYFFKFVKIWPTILPDTRLHHLLVKSKP